MGLLFMLYYCKKSYDAIRSVFIEGCSPTSRRKPLIAHLSAKLLYEGATEKENLCQRRHIIIRRSGNTLFIMAVYWKKMCFLPHCCNHGNVAQRVALICILLKKNMMVSFKKEQMTLTIPP